MAMLDVFNSDAFSVHSLTASIEKLPYMPGRIGRMGLFENKPVYDRTVIIEEKQGSLSLLPVKGRGSQEQTTRREDTRKVHAFVVPHVPHWDALLASDLEGKRAFGTEDQLEVFARILNDKLENMKADHEVTWEYHRIGALKGHVLDADGTSTVVNWFTQFGITETEIVFNFYDSGTYDQADPIADMKALCTQVKRAMQDALGATPFKGIHAFCGDAFFDKFVAHATVRKAYERYQENAFARTLQNDEGGFEFGGITWENYRGSIGGVDFVDDHEARFFPVGSKGIFIESTAPADFVETVNTAGKPLYAKQERMKWDKGIELHTQSNTLYMCTRPACLIKGVYANAATGTGTGSDV